MFLMVALTLTLLSIALSHLFFFLMKKKKSVDITSTSNTKLHSLPPSPPRLPIIGHLHRLGSLPHRSLRSLSDRYGPQMLLYLGRRPTLVVSSASIVREIIQNHDPVVSNRPFFKVPHTLLYNSHDIAFAPYGEYWREMKKVTILHLLSNKKVGSFKKVREEEVAFMMKEIEGTTIADMSERFHTLSREVISRTVIGKATRGSWWGDELSSLIKESSSLIGEFYIGDYVPWLGKVVGVGVELREE